MFVAQVRKERRELTFFEMEQRIGSVVIGRSPALIAFLDRDTDRRSGIVMRRSNNERFRRDGDLTHRLSAFGFRRSMNCCVHFSSNGAA